VPLLAAAEQLEPDHPVAARFGTAPFLLISWIGRSSAYRHAARYLEKLDAFSAYKDVRSRVDSHEAYLATLSKKALAEKWLLESRQGTKVTLAVL
jgi:hypothetical protein